MLNMQYSGTSLYLGPTKMARLVRWRISGTLTNTAILCHNDVPELAGLVRFKSLFSTNAFYMHVQ